MAREYAFSFDASMDQMVLDAAKERGMTPDAFLKKCLTAGLRAEQRLRLGYRVAVLDAKGNVLAESEWKGKL